MKAAFVVSLVLAITWVGSGPGNGSARAGDAAPGTEQLAQRRAALKQAPNELRIAAVVNSEVITVRDLRARLNFVLKTSRIRNDPETRKRLSKQILRSLIEERLKMQEARRLGIKVTKKELDASVGRLEANNNIPKGRLLPFFRSRGIDTRTVIEQIQAAIAWRRVIIQKIRPRVRISNEEVLEYIARVKANQGEKRYRVSEIFLSVDSPDQERDVRRTAQRLFEQIKKGVSFARIATQFSQSPTAKVGGDLGWIDQGSLPSELDNRLRQMKPGHVVGPVRTAGGYYILALRETRVIALGPTKEPTVSLTQVVLKYPPKAKDADRKRQLEQAKKISETASSCADLEKRSKELGVSGTSRLKNVKLASLAPHLRRPSQSLQVGRASPPIETKDGLTVIMVCQRDAGTDRKRMQSIRRALAARQMNILTRRYLRDLRRSAYLDVRV
ncbi:MAG: peptidylprolyl isomerase [Alphaproteobacteria bacterium]|nr:peptidylprolyl isomerase [Alphaproteobacteria bacterium]